MRRQLARIAVLTALLSLAGCDRAPQGGGALSVAAVGAPFATTTPTSLDPARVLLTEATQLGLLAADGAGGLAPALAKSWNVSDDGLRYIFRLRTDATWVDGRTITAGDAVVVLRRVLDRARAHPLRAHLPIAEVGAPAPAIVELRLVRPEPALLRLLAHPSLAIMRLGAAPPAAGPFARTGVPGAAVELAANADYHDAGAVALATVRLSADPDPRAAIAAFRAGRADIAVGGATGGLAAALAITDARALRLEESWGVYGLAWGPAAPVDPRVRRALNMAIDREALVARLFNVPAMRPMTGVVPPTLPGARLPAWASASIEERRARATALLAEAGRGNQPLVVTIAAPAGVEHRAIVRELTRQWREIGVDVVPAGVGAPALVAFERIAPAPLPRFFLLPLGASAQEPARAAERRLLDSDAAIALFTPARWALVAPGVTGWTPNVAGGHPLARLDRLRPTNRQSARPNAAL